MARFQIGQASPLMRRALITITEMAARHKEPETHWVTAKQMKVKEEVMIALHAYGWVRVSTEKPPTYAVTAAGIRAYGKR